MEFLQDDLSHLFDERGLDQSQYDDKVNFMDPLTKFNSVKGKCTKLCLYKSPVLFCSSRLFAQVQLDHLCHLRAVLDPLKVQESCASD